MRGAPAIARGESVRRMGWRQGERRGVCTRKTGTRGVAKNVLFEEVHDYCTFIERTGRGEVVQAERGDEALW